MYNNESNIIVIPVYKSVKPIAEYYTQGKGMNISDEENLRSLFSQNIRKYRQRKGWSQEKLAEKMEISTNYLSDIERKRGWVSPFSLVKMAKALGVEVFELFKPEEAAPADIKTAVNKYLDDFSSSLRVSFEKSLADSVRKIQKNL